jgi:hypothetical protein
MHERFNEIRIGRMPDFLAVRRLIAFPAGDDCLGKGDFRSKSITFVLPMTLTEFNEDWHLSVRKTTTASLLVSASASGVTILYDDRTAGRLGGSTSQSRLRRPGMPGTAPPTRPSWSGQRFMVSRSARR